MLKFNSLSNYIYTCVERDEIKNMKIPDFLNEILFNEYGNELTEIIKNNLSIDQKVTLRVNTLKSNLEEIKEILEKQQIQYTEIPWILNALIIENVDENEIRKLNIYEEGKIYLQSLSSMLPPIILEPQAGENILDMCAAPRW